jgi:acyl-CoA dehydrogenase
LIRLGTRAPPQGPGNILRAGERNAADPQAFSAPPPAKDAEPAPINSYLADPSIGKLIDFFHAKGVAALKDEDAREHFYTDWLDYQATHRLYASVLASKQLSDPPVDFDLLRFARFIEVFGYFSPAHAYSLQVSYLALFAIRLGTNDALKREAAATLEAGGLLAFGISEKEHGSDLLANEFTLRQNGGAGDGNGSDGRFRAAGRKYYIGNANIASIVAILANRHDARPVAPAPGTRRSPPVLFAYRPAAAAAAAAAGSGGVPGARKIRTLGIRAAFVGEFEVIDHEITAADIVADGRDAWDAVFGAVTLGRFFLGIGSVGICEHAMSEATEHLARRVLYRQPAIALPHIRSAMSRAYARLCAMKLYAYRALDYVAAATAADRRYLLFTAVQKAKVSTDGVKVISLISECVGAKGFESDTYIEMALRDIQLIPGLEGSTHLNLKLAAQFVNRYFAGARAGARGGAAGATSVTGATGAAGATGPGGVGLVIPSSLSAGDAAPRENPYLMSARTGPVNTIGFPHFLTAYRPLRALPNVRLFLRQLAAVRRFIRRGHAWRNTGAHADLETTLLVGQCQACIAYAQLIAEATTTFDTPPPLVSAMFDLLIGDLTAAALTLAALPQLGTIDRLLLRRGVAVPQTTAAEWEFVAQRMLKAFTP